MNFCSYRKKFLRVSSVNKVIVTYIVRVKMASFSRSSSEDSEQERESEDSDRILMEGGPVGSNL